jgi:hypothetical protein
MNDTTQPPGDGSAQPEAAAAPQQPSLLAELIEHWWHDHFPGSPVAQVTAAWNHAFAAKEELKRRLAELTKGE